jgi:hypothetical protein
MTNDNTYILFDRQWGHIEIVAPDGTRTESVMFMRTHPDGGMEWSRHALPHEVGNLMHSLNIDNEQELWQWVGEQGGDNRMVKVDLIVESMRTES